MTTRTGWHKASYSSDTGECVEVCFDSDTFLIRDSKYLRDPNNDPATQPIIQVSQERWPTFLAAVSGRAAAPPEPAIIVHSDGSATLRSADGITLDYTPTEWLYFTEAVAEGEFDDLAGQWKAAEDQLTRV